MPFPSRKPWEKKPKEEEPDFDFAKLPEGTKGALAKAMAARKQNAKPKVGALSKRFSK